MGRVWGQGPAESGQAAVETAITLPLVIFLALGSIQLAVLLQARAMAHYAAFRAARAGSVSQGDCTRMTHAAVGALLPVFARVTAVGSDNHPGALAQAFADRLVRDGKDTQLEYNAALDGGLRGAIVWIVRERPVVAAGSSMEGFDVPISERRSRLGEDPLTLEVRMIFWAPLKIPFANWVISRMLLARYGLTAWDGGDPTMVFKARADWHDEGKRLEPMIGAEYKLRAAAGQYVFPIQSSYVTRMMTPPDPALWKTAGCPPAEGML